ncbi:hypothetical protein Ddye_006725 [Dipteronia dyeriana]|uniref:Protein kinase domain-containing protein n=1 Tax=Dipteronia dyeriana TaxID=168575 RepID=A0AAE0CQY8_9ROSI|nr:hypothetical protein Ddye_006725 [Dipteronia dyeriana]
MINGSLDDWIKGRTRHSTGEPFGFMEKLNAAIDVASVVDYLRHDCKNHVVHCDLKSSNVLLHSNMIAKVEDFGLARLLIDRAGGQRRSQIFGFAPSGGVQSITCSNGLKESVGYKPPEYGQVVKPTTSGDAYCYGVMLLELFTWKSPTNQDFNGEMNLTKWAQSTFLTHTEQVLDTELLQPWIQPIVPNLFCPRCRLSGSSDDGGAIDVYGQMMEVKFWIKSFVEVRGNPIAVDKKDGDKNG